MKQIEITPEISAKIAARVGEDVDQTGFTVFEAIALNSLPLPGKAGTIFEDARVSELTLRQMADSINNGNTLPLISNHEPDEDPKGRVFDAGIFNGEFGETELRVLFYVDPTETTVVQKLNAASIDEVSVSFLASQLLCSECGFDYRGPDATYINLNNRICENMHTIGTNGVHIRLVGLAVFTETSLVTRGAANNPKIVGKSRSKLAAPLQQLAAKGFEIDKLYLSASRGENKVDIDKLVTELSDRKAEVITLSATKDTLTTQVTDLQTANTALTEKVTTLESDLEAAKAASKETELEAANTELSAAREVLADIYTKLATANGEKDVAAPESIADLKAGIEKHQSELTAILPVGGAAADGKTKEGQVGAKFTSVTGFKSNR